MYNKSSPFPCLEFPIRCCLSSTWNMKFLCNDKRQVSLTDERDVWSEWFIIPAANSACFHIQSVKTKQFLSISNEDRLILSVMKHDKWYMEKHPTADGGYIFIHEENGEPLGGGDSSENVLSFSEGPLEKRPEKSKNIWTMEVLTGELCFLSPSDIENLFIGCNLRGRTYTTLNSKGWEVWRFTEVGDGLVKISSWTHHTRYLCVDPAGLIYTTGTKKEDVLEGDETKWKIQRAPNPYFGVTIQDASTGYYLQLKEDELTTTNSPIGSSCVWHLTSANRNKYYLYSNSMNKRVFSNKIKPFVEHALSKDMSWTIQCISDGTFALYTESHSGYLGSDTNGNVTISPYLQAFEKWLIQETNDGSFYIISKKHDRFLYCGTNGKIHTVSNVDKSNAPSQLDEFNVPSCKWRLVTAMPPTVSREQILSLSIAGVAGVAAGVAVMTPVVAMSASCTTAGGAHAGCIVGSNVVSEAILGTSGVAAAMGTGALVGGSIYKLTNTSREARDYPGQIAIDSDNVIDEPIINRPLCAWETW